MGDGTWTCVRERAHSRTQGWESLVVRHATHSVSESLPELNVLSGALPPDALLATEEEHMCELPPGELASRLRQAEEGSNRRQEPSNLLHEIATKLPKWNGRTQSFELAFHGRAKLEEDEYALDFAHPLSPVHAFAFFLCTSSW